MRVIYPFTAIVGQERMKRALILNAINPQIGGVLIRGERGTAKSTAARALAALLPGDTPFVDLPVSATEDRVVGTLDIEKAIQKGERHFEPGILAAANGGVLYVDEVNLLDDHVVDILLDSAAMGVNIVEREGISYQHDARFVLVGSMNPEEGDLRPQLLDRFAHAVDVVGLTDSKDRVNILRSRIIFEQDPDQFLADGAAAEESMRQRIVSARELYDSVGYSDKDLYTIATLTASFKVDGHRADIVILRTARAQAAYDGRTQISDQDILLAAELALPHRMKKQPFQETVLTPEQLDSNMRQARAEAEQAAAEEESTEQGEGSASADEKKGKRSYTRTDRKRGRYIKSRPAGDRPDDIAFDATLRAAAPYQSQRQESSNNDLALKLRRGDLQRKIRVRRTGNLILFVVDASWSMAASERMEATKGAIFSLLIDAYQRRDQVGLVVFQRDKARLVLPPTNSVELAQKALQDLPVGGKTPLSSGLFISWQVIENAKRRDSEIRPLMIVLTDGAGNVSMTGVPAQEEAMKMADIFAQEEVRSIVINMEHAAFDRGLAQKLADSMGGVCYNLPELRADTLLSTVKREIGG